MPFKKTTLLNPHQPGDAKRIFIGRTDQIHFFINCIFEPHDPGHNIISIAGQGGVGKSTLVNRLIDEARTPRFRDYCLATLVKEGQTTPANVMERFADRLREMGYPLKNFAKVLTGYKEALRRIRIGYRDEQEVLLREVIDAAGTIADEIPLAGGLIHKGANTLAEVVLDKGHTHQLLKDIARLEDPISDLTTAFVKDLNQIADTVVTVRETREKRPRHLLLFFDTFEQLASDIAPWLLDYFLEADISTNIVLVFAGRDSIETSIPNDPKRWLPLLDSGIIYRMSLDSFTAEETQTYLRERGITNPERVKEITQLSRGLPLYLSMWTSNPEGSIDPTAEVVENFLRWLPKDEPLKWHLALDASLFSRPFNQDDLTAFAHLEQERNALYKWIIGQPFVQSNPQDGRQSYHALAQELFSRYLYQRSPEEYYATRRTIAEHYQRQIAKMEAVGGKETYTSHPWQELELALIQQLFLIPDEASHIKGIEQVLRVSQHTLQTEELVKVLHHIATKESANHASPAAQQTAEKLIPCIEDDTYGTYNTYSTYRERLISMSSLLEKVTRMPSFSPEALACIYESRGRMSGKYKQYPLALADLDQALALAPQYTQALRSRGAIYQRMGHYAEAIADFTSVLALDEQDQWTLGMRGETYRIAGCYQEALLDLNRAIALDENDDWAIVRRGDTYRKLERYHEALTDFAKTLALHRSPGALVAQAKTYRQMHYYQEALADLDHALSLDKNSVYALVNRAKVYRITGDYQKALADLDRTIALIEQDRWPITPQGEPGQQAPADPDHVIHHDTDWYWYERALIHLLIEQQAAFRSDIEAAINTAKTSLLKIPEYTSDYHRISFNLALYHLTSGNTEKAEILYNYHSAECKTSYTLRDAANDVREFLTIVPEPTIAKQTLAKINERIGALSQI